MSRPRGRPSEFNPAYANEIIELMASGLSLTAAAAELGFVKQTVYNWANENPEFMDAINLGKGKRTAFLERRLLTADSGPVVTSSIFALKNAAPDEWREKQLHEITGQDGGPIKHEVSARDAIANRISSIAARAAAAGDNKQPDGSAGE